MLENASAEVVGFGTGQGRDELASRDGWLQKTLFSHEPRALDAQVPARVQRVERVVYLGEPIVALWRKTEGGEAVEEFFRFEEQDGRLAWIRDYCFCPETLAEVAADLRLPVRTRGYRLSDQEIGWDRARRRAT